MINETQTAEKGGIEIIEVTTKADLKAFVRFPTWLYRGNSFYVHPLELDELTMLSPKNPSWEQVEIKMFLALKSGGEGSPYKHDKKVVGRIAVMVQKLYNQKNGVNYARFTRFDFADDKAVAFALLDAGFDFAKKQGMDAVHGPLGFNDLDKEGLLVDGFDKISTFAESYNYAYYKKHIEDYGFEKEVDWLEFVIQVPESLDERVAKVAERMRERLGLRILPREMSVKQILAQYGKQVFDLLNVCYADLHGVIPITEKVRESVLKQFKQIIKRDHICIVLEGDTVIGFSLTAPNISRSLNRSKGKLCKLGFLPVNALGIMREAKKPRYVDLCLIAVAPEYRAKGVSAIMMNDMFGNLVRNKIISVETNLQLENNTDIIKMFDGYGKELVKRRRCYIKKID